MGREPPLRDDELRTLRAIMTEYRQEQAVNRWLGSKWRAVAAVAGIASAVTIVTASLIEIAKAVTT